MRVLAFSAIRPLRYILLAVLAMAMQTLSAQEASGISFSLQPDMPLTQVVAPAASGQLVLIAHNNEETPARAAISGFVFSAAEVADEYVFTTDQRQKCDLPTIALDSAYGLQRISFASEPIAPGADMTCSYSIARKATSRSDFVFTLCGPGEFVDCLFRYLAFGTLPDLGLRVAPIEPPRAGSLETIVSVIASNPGSHPTSDIVVATDCAEFYAGAVFGPVAFDIDNDFPGACPTAEDNLGCLNFTGQEFESKGFHLGSIPAHGEASCLLKLRFRHPLTESVSLGLQFLGNFVQYAEGGAGFDANTGNDRALASAAPSASLTPIPTPIDRPAYALLALLLGVIGATTKKARARMA
ncbi:MAG: hypothetical protein ABIW82_01795 [Dokdonella sp.]